MMMPIVQRHRSGIDPLAERLVLTACRAPHHVRRPQCERQVRGHRIIARHYARARWIQPPPARCPHALMSGHDTVVPWRIREHGDDIGRSRIQETPLSAPNVALADVQAHLKRRRLPHHARAVRTDSREVRLHTLVAFRVELTRSRPHIALRFNAGGDELQPFFRRVTPQRLEHRPDVGGQRARSVRRRRGVLDLAARLERQSAPVRQMEARRTLLGPRLGPAARCTEAPQHGQHAWPVALERGDAPRVGVDRQQLDLCPDPTRRCATRREAPTREIRRQQCAAARTRRNGHRRQVAEEPIASAYAGLSFAIHSSRLKPASWKSRCTLARSYLQLISVRMDSPARKGTVPTCGMCTSIARRETRCISMRCATRLYHARCAKSRSAKSAPSSRFSTRKTLRLNSAVTPAASLYAASITRTSFCKSMPSRT